MAANAIPAVPPGTTTGPSGPLDISAIVSVTGKTIAYQGGGAGDVVRIEISDGADWYPAVVGLQYGPAWVVEAVVSAQKVRINRINATGGAPTAMFGYDSIGGPAGNSTLTNGNGRIDVTAPATPVPLNVSTIRFDSSGGPAGAQLLDTLALPEGIGYGFSHPVGANPATIIPDASDSINGGAPGAPFVVPPGKGGIIFNSFRSGGGEWTLLMYP